MLLIGLFSGFTTGLLSIGGGFVSIFSLLFLPGLITGNNFTMQTITGFSMMLAFFSTLSGSYYYLKEKLIDLKVVLFLGIPSLFGGMAGALAANYLHEFTLKVIFLILGILAAILMLIPSKPVENLNSSSFTNLLVIFSIVSGILIGFLGGLIGLAAGFIFVPFIMYIYKLSIKKSIGTSLITCFLLSFGSLLMKLSIGSFPIGLGIMLVIGGIFGAQIGGKINNLLPSLVLKKVAALSILIISLKLLLDVFSNT